MVESAPVVAAVTCFYFIVALAHVSGLEAAFSCTLRPRMTASRRLGKLSASPHAADYAVQCVDGGLVSFMEATGVGISS